MRLTIEIPEDEIEVMAKQIVAEHVAKTIINSEYGGGRVYRNSIKEVIREVIRSDIDNLSERAVAAASKSIENRGIKKMLETIEVEHD